MVNKFSKLLTTPTNELGKMTRFLVLQIRIWFHFGRLFIRQNRCLTQAAALAYHSIFGLVPLVIVSLMVFQMFPAFDGVSEKVKNFAYEQMNLTSISYPADDTAEQPIPTEETGQSTSVEDANTITVADKLDELTAKYITKAHTGAITVVGLGLVIWAAIALLTTIEKTFNHIYHVSVGRAFLHRLLNYWGFLTFGPLLLAAMIYVSSQYLLKSGNVQGIYAHIAPVIPFLISVLAFFLLYYFLPNTRVSAGSALWGAFAASLIWTGAKVGFGYYLKNVPGFAVYGVLGIIPITVMWIYVSWLIVLFGLQLTYATQNVKRLDAAEFAKMRRQDTCFLANTQTVIRVMEYVLNAFERKDQKPVSVEAVAYRLGMPTDFTEKILERMVRSNLLCRTDDPSVGYVPSTDGTHITLDEISRAISEVSFAQVDAAGPARMREVFAEFDQLLSRFTLKEVLNKDEDFTIQQELLIGNLSPEAPQPEPDQQ